MGQILAARKTGSLAAIGQVELFQDIVDVDLDCVLGDIQAERDFAV